MRACSARRGSRRSVPYAASCTSACLNVYSASGALPRRQISSASTSPRQGLVELLLRHRRDCADHLVGEAPAQRRADLRDLARRRKAVEPRQQRSMERRWNLQHRSAVPIVMIASVRQRAALDHGLGQFLDEQRDAVGAVEDFFGDRFAAALPWATLATIAAHWRGSSRPSVIGVVCMRPAHGDTNSGREVRIMRRGRLRRALDDQVDQFERGGIGPMQVLDHQQHRSRCCQPFDVRRQRLEGLLLALLRREVRRRRAIAASEWRANAPATAPRRRASPVALPSAASSLTSRWSSVSPRRKPAARSSWLMNG